MYMGCIMCIKYKIFLENPSVSGLFINNQFWSLSNKYLTSLLASNSVWYPTFYEGTQKVTNDSVICNLNHH